MFPNSPDEDTVKIVADKPILTIPVDSYPTEVTAEEVVIEEGNLEICDEEGEKVLLCGEIVLKQKKDKATPPKNLTDESVEDAVHSVNVEENSREVGTRFVKRIRKVFHAIISKCQFICNFFTILSK